MALVLIIIAVAVGLVSLGGGITSLGVVAPISSTGGTAPTLSIAACPDGETYTFDSGTSTWTCGNAGHTIQDEAVSLATEPTLNFTGAGVVCADNPGNTRTDCTITGVAGSGVQLDLGNDDVIESTGITEINVDNDTNSIFTETPADQLLIDASLNWPISDDVSCTDCLNATEIEDIYVLIVGDTVTGNIDFDDGVGESPRVLFSPQTGTVWDIYAEDATDDLQIEVTTAVAEGLDIVNTGAGIVVLSLDSLATGGASECVEADTNGVLALAGSACASGGGDSIEVEDGDNTGTFSTIDTTARFEDSADINFSLADGGPGGPDDITGTVRANAVALATDTTGAFVATVADSGNTNITVAGSGAENAAVTLDVIDVNCTNCLDATEIADIYVLVAGDVMTGNLDMDDGTTDSPRILFTVQTGTVWDIYAEDTSDDLQIEVTTGVAENLDIVNTGAGTVVLTLDSLATGGASECVQTDTNGVFSNTGGACGGGSVDLQGAYDNEVNPALITLDNTIGGIIFDGDAELSDPTFTIRDDGGSVGILIDNDDEAGNEASPPLRIANSTAAAGDTQFSFIVTATSELEIRGDDDAADLTIEADGDLDLAANLTCSSCIDLGGESAGAYVATVADSGNTNITVAGSGGETAAVTLDVIGVNCTDCLGATEITDIYVLVAGDVMAGNLDFDDGTTDSPRVLFRPQTGTLWNLYAADSDDDFQIEVNTAVTEVVELTNLGIGDVDLTLDGDINCTNCITLATETVGAFVNDITGGDGISSTGGGAEDSTPTIAIDLTDDADGTSATTAAESGLEFLTSELSLLRGCSNGEILKWTLGTEDWGCSADSTGGSPTFDTIASGTNTTATMTIDEGAEIILATGGINEASEVLNTVHNDSGATLFQCTAVYLNGFDIPADLPDVLIADSDVSGAAIGLIFSDAVTGSDVLIVVSGQMDDLDTVTGEGWTVGDTLYLNDSGTSADNDCGNTLTNVRPANTDDIVQAIAKVERVHATKGRLEVVGAGRGNDVPNLPDDQVWVGSATNVATGVTVTDSDAATEKLQYDQATNTFITGTDDTVPKAGDFANATDLDLNGAINCTDCLNATEIEDIYVLIAGDVIEGDLDFDDGVTDSPKVLFRVQTGVVWSVYAEDGADDLQFEVNSGTAETIDFINLGAGVIDITVDGTITGTTAVAGPNVTSGADPGHTHTGGSLGGIDISDDTNLTCGTNCTLTDDEISVDDVFVLTAGDTIAGDLSFDDGVGDTPKLNFTPATGDVWNIYVDDASGDLQFETNTGGQTSFDFVNLGLGTMALFLDGDIDAGNPSGGNSTIRSSSFLITSTWTNFDDQGEIRLSEPDGAGTEYISIQAPATLASNRLCVLEDDATPFDPCVSGAGGGDITAVGPGYSSGAAFTDTVVSVGTEMLVWEGTASDANELTISAPANPAVDQNFAFPDDQLADDDLIIANGAGTFEYKATPDCDATNISRLQYDTTTNLFICDTDPVAAGEYAAASIDGDDVNSNIAGAHLTLTAAAPDTLDLDVEIFTNTTGIWFEDPTAADDFESIWVVNGFAVTITKIWCESDQTVNMDLQIDDGTPADVNGTDLVCDGTPAFDEAMGGDATMADGDRLDLVITSVSGTPTWVSIMWTYTKDD